VEQREDVPVDMRAYDLDEVERERVASFEVEVDDAEAGVEPNSEAREPGFGFACEKATIARRLVDH
jgi:hypothetical protein